MTSRADVEGFILAGGSSSRMGAPKAALLIGGEPIVSLVARALTPVVERITLVTDRPDEVGFLGLPTIPDLHHGSGPLGGLHAALTSAQTSSLFLLSCDLPFMSGTLLGELLRRHGPHPITLPRTSDGLHPLCGLYDRSLLPAVEEHLRKERLSMRRFVESVGAEVVDVTACRPRVDPACLMNVNTPEDLAAARTRSAR